MSAAAQADPNPQTSFEEVIVNDPELEELLEKRQKAKDSAKAVNKKAREADIVAKDALEKLKLGDVPHRIGRFVVSIKPTAAKSVSFETAAGTRLSIKADKPE